MKIKRLFLAFVIGALFCVIGWTATAQTRTTTRQSWEYKNLYVSGMYWRENGKQLGGNAEQLLWTKLQELGDQGWEMMPGPDCATGTNEGSMMLWFKRPK